MMPITLVFHGGLFTALPGTGPTKKVDVHIRLLERVQVTDSKGEHLPDLEASLGTAVRADFEAGGGIRPDELPIRPVSHLIPVDYQSFRKAVSFNAGTVSGTGGSMPSKSPIVLTAVKKRADPTEMLEEFKRFAGIDGHEHDREYIERFVPEFYSWASAKELRCWTSSYLIQVKLPGRGAKVVLNGHTRQELPNGIRVEFLIQPGSTIPHFPLGNPHVMEAPPTR
jgi:hypothetical protein